MKDDFTTRYGPWALVVGASEGVGAAYARAMAERGLNVVLLARRQAVLDEVAAEVRDAYGVETRTIALDLTAADAATTIIGATAGLDIGMLMYCAGGETVYEPFLANSVELALAVVQRNCIVPMQLCHHFAGPMVANGRGGIILVSSIAGLIGSPNMVAYCASKAFDLVMGEALWAELHASGVDVLSLVLGATDTPGLRRLLTKRGTLSNPGDPLPLASSSPDEVVDAALEQLGGGSTWMAGEQARQMQTHLSSMSRSRAVRSMLKPPRSALDDGRDAEGLA